MKADSDKNPIGYFQTILAKKKLEFSNTKKMITKREEEAKRKKS